MEASTRAKDDRSRRTGDEDAKEAAARYRRAAEATLDQLDSCVDILHRLRKPGIARAVGKNRSAIRARMSRTDD
jgi:hypothetical protein